MKNTYQYFIWIALVLISAISTGCDRESRFPEPFYITSHPTIEVVTGPGRYVLDAQCPSGRQLLGGGYFITEGDYSFQVGLLANYPSNTNTWTAIFEVPNSGSSNRVEGHILVSTAYCLSTPDYPLNSTIVTAQGGQSQGQMPFNIKAECPAGSVLTGGGYSTGKSSPSFATFNSNVIASLPVLGEYGAASGWQVGLVYPLPQENPPITTVYALCAQQNLSAGPVVSDILDLTTLPFAYGSADTQTTCPRGAFTTGGGYSLVGDYLIPHQVSSSVAQREYSTWINSGIFGYQTPNYEFRPCDPVVNPDCAKTAAFAACVQVPDIPYVKVKILTPEDSQSFGPFGNTNQTVPINFTAEATDENGNPLTGSALQWFQNGVPFGSGESLLAPLSTSPDAVTFVKIKVTAAGISTVASDEVKISVGRID
jgi:hypothetical protein